ncbi:MAG: cell division protein FtsZ [Novosphingobium sp.]
MSINIGPPSVEELRPRITVIGVGGAGGNAIANMIAAEIEGVDFIVANTDAQALNNSIVEHRIQLGPDITQGLGAGSRPEVGRAAAEETVEELERALDGVNMCFIAAGMGGGTGTGAAPVIAEAARRKGVLTVGVVTKPFLFEGTRRMRAADAGIQELQKHVDTLIVIPNQNLFLVAKAETTFKEAFQLADEVLQQGVRSITDLMVMPGLINLDFADVRSVMGEMGKAMMGTGEGEGENRALEAAERAIANPLLDGVSMQGAKGVIISIIGGDDMKLLEVDEAANHIRELVDQDANIIWGSAFNPDLQGKIRVSVVATGIDQDSSGVGAVESDARPLNLGASRAPKRPVLPLPTEAELSYGAAPADNAGLAEAAPQAEPRAFEKPYEAPVAAEASGNGGFGGIEAGTPGAAQGDEPFELTFELNDTPAAEEDGEAEDDSGSAGYASLAPEDDGLLRDADRLVAEDAPVSGGLLGRRRGLISGGEPADAPPAPAQPNAGGGASAGTTLFERMANLSRGTRDERDEDDGDEDGGGSALNIPRFLGRQNNQ